MEIFHITERAAWEAAERSGEYTLSTRGRTLAEEGFIHCSRADQVAGVAAASYADVPDLVLLTIDTDLLAPGIEVRVEDGFPHIFGPLAVSAVVRVEPLRSA